MKLTFEIREWLFTGVLAGIAFVSVSSMFAQTPQAATVQKDASSPEAHFDSAQTFQIASDLTRAAAEYRKGISVALERVGNLKVAKGEFTSALDLLRKAVATDPENTDGQIDLSIAYFRAGNYEGARTVLLPLVKSDPGSARGRNLMGKILFMQGDFEGASTELQAALSITPDFDVAYSLALAYLQLKKLPQVTPLVDEMKASMAKSPELYMLLGQAYRQTGYYDQAVSEFKTALALDAARPRLHNLLGTTYVALGGKQNYELARAEFQQELAKNPKDYSSHYYLGLIELEDGQYAKAEAALKTAHALAPDDPAAMLLLGRLYDQQKNWNAAIEVLRQVLARSSAQGASPVQLATTHEMLSKAYAGAGQIPESEKELAAANALKSQDASKSATSDPAVAIQPENSGKELRAMLMQGSPKAQPSDASEQKYVADISKLLGNAYNNLGVIDARAGSYKQAADEFKEAAKWDDSIPQLDRNRGLAAFRAQAYADAIPPLERLLKKSPSDSNLRESLGLSYYMTDKFKESAATLRPIVDTMSNNPGLLLSAGVAFVKSGDIPTGQRLFTRAFEVGKATPEIHLIIGQAYAEQSDNDEALAEFKQALELNPKLPDAHFYIGMVRFKRGEFDDAAKEFQQELEVNPQSVQAMYQLAYIRMQQHQAPEASSLLSEVIKQQPNNSDAHYQLGKALLEQGDAGGATRELETSVKLHPTDYAYFQLSHAYARTGREADSKQALEEFEKLKPKPKTPMGP
ncbi:Tetratricopeptide repeat protein [Candidatus Koribacter versatilis Ellin345]|uniref:Tetratricopeptide repeat protein n=1 Tax=Koribacter versatilis (strain Ellin345) TaxID=204669 RepID=Q1IT85_KORVE|nr:tetratricopeptide repeat protein [Candidatus Koribacter versatilis]ABF39915.1 Tetratricopeptide repeat protein [Candidatus Koribacter versatilis Ellin345]